jgi:hypothetical protein
MATFRMMKVKIEISWKQKRTVNLQHNFTFTEMELPLKSKILTPLVPVIVGPYFEQEHKEEPILANLEMYYFIQCNIPCHPFHECSRATRL